MSEEKATEERSGSNASKEESPVKLEIKNRKGKVYRYCSAKEVERDFLHLRLDITDENYYRKIELNDDSSGNDEPYWLRIDKQFFQAIGLSRWKIYVWLYLAFAVAFVFVCVIAAFVGTSLRHLLHRDSSITSGSQVVYMNTAWAWYDTYSFGIRYPRSWSVERSENAVYFNGPENSLFRRKFGPELTLGVGFKSGYSYDDVVHQIRSLAGDQYEGIKVTKGKFRGFPAVYAVWDGTTRQYGRARQPQKQTLLRMDVLCGRDTWFFLIFGGHRSDVDARGMEALMSFASFMPFPGGRAQLLEQYDEIETISRAAEIALMWDRIDFATMLTEFGLTKSPQDPKLAELKQQIQERIEAQ